MLLPERRVPWWQWALLSLGTSLLVAGTTLAAVIALAFQGVDLFDYIFLSRPPLVTSGTVAAWLALLIGGQTLCPLLMLLLFRPSRSIVAAGLAPGRDPSGLALRLVLGAAGALVLQFLWDRSGSAPPEHWRLVEHVISAVVHGGRIWPMVWMVVTIGLVVPLAEEVLFRGFLFRWLRSRWGFWAGALLTAGLFGISHGLANAIPTALLGFYFAYQAEQDGTLLGAIALHMLNNLGALVAMSAIT